VHIYIKKFLRKKICDNFSLAYFSLKKAHCKSQFDGGFLSMAELKSERQKSPPNHKIID
jgi:hypothetical protein